MEAVAKLRNCPLPPRKMRLLADLVRDLPVDDALNVLRLHPKKMYSRYLEKLILSAIANWQEKNEDLDVEDSELFIKTIFVDGGRTLKRIQPAPQGRAHRIRKRSNHITLIIDSAVEMEEEYEEDEEMVEAVDENIEEENTEKE